MEYAELRTNLAEFQTIAEEAYIYGYPLLLMEVTRRVYANKPVAGRVPVNQWIHRRRFQDAKFKTVVRPNVDTLYSVTWLDLSNEPITISIPQLKNGYYTLQMMDMWTHIFASLGNRTTGRGPVSFAVVGPKWNGILPDNTEKIQSPTTHVWVVAVP